MLTVNTYAIAILGVEDLNGDNDFRFASIRMSTMNFLKLWMVQKQSLPLCR